jgi:hypothetical protein
LESGGRWKCSTKKSIRAGGFGKPNLLKGRHERCVGESVILTEGKDLVVATRIEILPSFVGQDDIFRQQVVRAPFVKSGYEWLVSFLLAREGRPFMAGF